jgi:hypothetical protein
MIQKLVGGIRNANHFANASKMVHAPATTDDMPTADDLAWVQWFNELKATVYPSDKVAQVMAVFQPLNLKLQQTAFLSQEIYHYEM